MASAYFDTKRRFPEVDSLTPEQQSGDAIDRELLSPYEQLLATRLDLMQGAGPADGELSLSRGEFESVLDCVLAQLHSAIVTTRSMVSAVVPVPGMAQGTLDVHSAYGRRPSLIRCPTLT